MISKLDSISQFPSSSQKHQDLLIFSRQQMSIWIYLGGLMIISSCIIKRPTLPHWHVRVSFNIQCRAWSDVMAWKNKSLLLFFCKSSDFKMHRSKNKIRFLNSLDSLFIVMLNMDVFTGLTASFLTFIPTILCVFKKCIVLYNHIL